MTTETTIAEARDSIEARAVAYLEGLGYQTLKQAKRVGKSGLEQTFDILAQKDDGFTLRTIAIEIITVDDKETATTTIFDFANKAYDAGIKDRVLITLMPLPEEAKELAVKQRIKVVEQDKVETMLGQAQAVKPGSAKPFRFEGKDQLLENLTKLGYRVEERAAVKGRSGVDYTFDILAYANGSRISHSLGIDIFQAARRLSWKRWYSLTPRPLIPVWTTRPSPDVGHPGARCQKIRRASGHQSAGTGQGYQPGKARRIRKDR